MLLIALVSAWGNSAVERLFAYVSFLLYATYAVFLVLSLTQFGDRVGAAFASGAPTAGWALGGLTYAGYNIIGAIVILPRHSPHAEPGDDQHAGRDLRHPHADPRPRADGDTGVHRLMPAVANSGAGPRPSTSS